MAGALHSPKGITFHSNRPLRVQKAAAFRALGVISTCQYPDVKSSVLKYLAVDNVSKVSWMRGSGYASLMVLSFKSL